MRGARARRGIATLFLAAMAPGCVAYQAPRPGPLPQGGYVRVTAAKPPIPFVLIGDVPGGTAVAARCTALEAAGRVHSVSGDTLRLRQVVVVRRAAASDPQCENLGDAAMLVRGSGSRLLVERFSAGHTAILGAVVVAVIGFIAFAASQIEYEMDLGCALSTC